MSRVLTYDTTVETALSRLEGLLRGHYNISKRAVGLLLLQDDSEVTGLVKGQEGTYPAIAEVVHTTQDAYSQPLAYIIARARQDAARHIITRTVSLPVSTHRGFPQRLSQVMMSPATGIPLLLLALIGLYYFVGVFGAGVVVDFLEGTVFGQYVNPWFTRAAEAIIPWQVLRDLFVGEYGLITLGLTYAFAIVLPIVGTFFIAFSIIEDSGYLPRLAMLIDRLFKKIGLSGRAVIPMVLGFGCDTMATIVTRTQETRRERIIATLLLALAIPCSAQLGVIFGILSGSAAALFTWGGVVFGVFLLVGYLASKVIPGERPSFFMEIPPLRLPRIGNILSKTYTRMQWYFLEVLPFFLLASFLIWLGDISGVFQRILSGLEPVMRLLDLPAEAGTVFLYGFFRRDFGAAGLYDLHSSGEITGVALVVAAVTLTLFIPCIAQLAIMFKERGVRVALAIGLFIFPFAFFIGFLLNLVLRSLEVGL